MAYEVLGTGDTFTVPAGADLSALQYTFVDLNSSGAAVAPSNGARAVGVLQNAPTSGQAATVAKSGISKVVAGGSITRGASVTTNGSGAAIAATTGLQIHGVALYAADSGDIIPVLLKPGANVA